MLSAYQVVLNAKEGKAKELKELLNELVEFSVEFSGCQKFELYQLNEQREEFFIIEMFKSEKKQKAYIDSQEYKALELKVNDFCDFIGRNELKLTQCLTKLGLKKAN